MVELQQTVAGTVGAITAMGTLGTAAFGLVDASKAIWGGVSNFGFGAVEKAVAPFMPSRKSAGDLLVWRETLRANWINGVPKEDQKTAAKALIRMDLSASRVKELAKAADVSEKDLQAAMDKVEANAGAPPSAVSPLTPGDALVLGRLNAKIDAAMDAGYERGDQIYRNASKAAACLVAIGLSFWAGHLLLGMGTVAGLTDKNYFEVCFLTGLLATPIAPIAKDLASSLQAAANAVSAVKS